ncbi:MAG: thioether cross-link-forming SCIFF peptide maturase [Peptococcaceae bacterium]|nr:thioether cross-link-forming SCIFF peptide maturase [Peptococcaceae bacterium]
MLRIDHYDIHKNVHVYRQGKINIAYDVNSGSLHILDDKTAQFIWEMIRVQKQGLNDPDRIFTEAGSHLSSTEKKEILQELAELQRDHLLFSPEAERVEPVYPVRPVIKAMCLHVAHDCNLRCGYCFAGTGAFGGDRELMSFQTGRLALDFLLQNSGNRPHCEVDFFGGEPLMNFQVVKELIAYGKKAADEAGKKIKFTLTTNAVLLDDEVSNYLEEEGISVVLSLDGRKEVNDRMRPFAGGKGSYDRIMPHILRFIEKRPSASRYAIGKYYYVRGTYTRYNTDFYQDVLHMADRGIRRISVEPVVAPPEEDYAIRQEDMDAIKESYDILGDKVLEYMNTEKEFTFFHFNAGLDDGPCLPKRLSGCGAGHEYVAISPEGEIYPCHQFVGQEKYKLGSLYETEKLNKMIVDSFRKAYVYAKEECCSCWARFSCSGGCHAANASFSGELTKVYPMGCELQKKRLEVAFYIKIKEREQRILV